MNSEPKASGFFLTDKRKQAQGFGLFVLLLWSVLDYGGRYLHVQAASQAMTGGLLVLFLLGQRFWLPLRDYSLAKPTLIFYAVLWLSWFFSINQLASLEEVLRYSMYLSLPYLILSWCTSETEKQQFSFLLAWVAIIVCLVGWGLQFFNQQGVSGTFYRTNDLASYLLLLMPLMCHLTLITSNLRLRLLYGIAGTLALISLIATNSRSAWISLLIALCVLGWFHRHSVKERSFKLIVLLMGSGTLIGLLVNFPSLWHRLQSLGNLGTENSILWRWSLLKGAWNIFLDHPIIGTGIHTFAQVYPQYQESAGYFSISPHNYYLELLAETGILGLGAFLFLMVMIARNLLQQSKVGNVLSLGILASLVGSLCHIAFEISWSVSAIPILFFALTGLGLSSELPVEAVKPTNLTWLEKGLIMFASLFISILPTMNYFSAQAATRAAIHLEEGKESESLVEVTQAMQFSPWPSARHQFILSSYYFTKKQFAPAAYFIERALQLNPTQSEYYHLAARIFEKQERHQQALEMLIQAVELNPFKHPSLYTLVGDYYAEHKANDEQAMVWYKKGERAFKPEELKRYEAYTPGDRYELFNLYYKLSECYHRLGMETETVTYLKQSEQLLQQASPDPIPGKGSKTPVQALAIYWKDLKKSQELNRSPQSESTYPGRTLPYPPGEFTPDNLIVMQAERDHTSAQLIYRMLFKLPTKKEPSWLMFRDDLILTPEGWKIHLRRAT